MRGDMGSNPTQGEFSFKHLFTKYDYLGCIGLVVLSYSIHIYSIIYIVYNFGVVFFFLIVTGHFSVKVDLTYFRKYCSICNRRANNIGIEPRPTVLWNKK